MSYAFIVSKNRVTPLSKGGQNSGRPAGFGKLPRSSQGKLLKPGNSVKVNSRATGGKTVKGTVVLTQANTSILKHEDGSMSQYSNHDLTHTS